VVKEDNFPTSFGKATKLEHPIRSRVVKEDKFPTSFGNAIKLEHFLRLRVVKEAKFSTSLGKATKFEHPNKLRVVKEDKFPTSVGNATKLVHPPKSRVFKNNKLPTSFGNAIKREQELRFSLNRVWIDANLFGNCSRNPRPTRSRIFNDAQVLQRLDILLCKVIVVLIGSVCSNSIKFSQFPIIITSNLKH